MKKENKKEDAVSPVIGVMLMLVVTIVIAAVVVMFSTGLAGSTETTPTALFEVSYTGTWNSEYGSELANVGLRHKGGDVIPLKDLQITFETKGGYNSGIVNTYLATNVKSRSDMTQGEYTIDDFSKSQFERFKKDINDALTTISNTKQKYGITEDVMTWTSPSDSRWEELAQNYNMDQYDAYYLKQAPQKYQNRLNVFVSNGWDINANSPPGTPSGEKTYLLSVHGQEIPTESIVSTGDIINIVPYNGEFSNRIFGGTSVKWTISYIPTNSIIAKGEFEVIAD